MKEPFLDQALALFNVERRLEHRGASDHQADLQFLELLPEEQLIVLQLERELKRARRHRAHRGRFRCCGRGGADPRGHRQKAEALMTLVINALCFVAVWVSVAVLSNRLIMSRHQWLATVLVVILLLATSIGERRCQS